MPSDCFSDEINDEMYAYIIKITQSVVLMDVGAIQSSIFNFMLYMSDFADKCGISGIVNSVFSDFQEETSAYIIARIMEYAFDI